jgi:hypothetical protein
MNIFTFCGPFGVDEYWVESVEGFNQKEENRAAKLFAIAQTDNDTLSLLIEDRDCEDPRPLPTLVQTPLLVAQLEASLR